MEKEMSFIMHTPQQIAQAAPRAPEMAPPDHRKRKSVYQRDLSRRQHQASANVSQRILLPLLPQILRRSHI